MTASQHAVAERWAQICLGEATKPLGCPSLSTRGDRIFLHGSSFELARPLRDRAGRVVTWLLNGDQPWRGGWGNSVSRTQATIRVVVTATKIPFVIIPYSALDAAGVRLDSIRVLETLPDRVVRTEHQSTTFPPGAVWHPADVWERLPRTEAEIAEGVAALHQAEVAFWTKQMAWHQQALAQGRPSGWAHWAAAHPAPPEPISREDYLRRAGAERLVKTGVRQVLRRTRSRYSAEITTQVEDGVTVYRWETHEHRLGESLIRARIDWREDGVARRRWTTLLSGWDHQEARPLYFLCELPYRSRPTTVAEAYEVLRPEPVLLAEQMGREVTRQGDIFAVPAPSLNRRALRKMGARFAKRGALLATNHVATEVAYLPGGVTLARGCLYHAPRGRRPDHARRTLADGWHVVVKNTVPVGRR